LEIQRSRELTTLTTSIERYPAGLIRSVGTVRTSREGDALVCNVLWREVQIGSVQLAQALADVVADLGSDTEDLGLQGTTEAQGFTAAEAAALGA
jgi:hypothetical protein